MAAIPDTLGANDSLAVQRQTLRHYGELSDAARDKELRDRAIEEADNRTREARKAIKALSRSLTEQEACALISQLTAAIAASGFGHQDAAQSAMESLTDAHAALED